MFTNTKPDSELRPVYITAVNELQNHKPDSLEYKEILEHTVKLHKMMEDEKPSSISPDTVATIFANLVGIVLVLKHEQLNVITTKALTLAPKVR